MKRLTLFILPVLTALLSGCEKEAASVGIIGGADGPTAILVSSNFPGMVPVIIIGVIAIIAIAAVVIHLITKKD